MRLCLPLIALLLSTCAWALVPTGPLPRDVVPTYYHLDLQIDPGEQGYSGQVLIDVDIRRATPVIWLHGSGLTLHEVELERDAGRPIPLQAELADAASGVLALRSETPLATGPARLRIRFDAAFDQSLEGTYLVERDSRRYVMTQMQPLGARRSFPCFDEPAFKTPWNIAIAVPDGMRVFANTRQRGREKFRDGWARYVFDTTEALPSYLIAYAVGPWDLLEHAPLPPSAQRNVPLPLRGITVAGRSEEIRYALEQTQTIVEALEAYFDRAYPYDKMDVLAAPDFAAGAMENAGLMLYREALLFVDADTPPDALRAFHQVHVHEIAHQWFGNLVTMPWWEDLWLNEAFATWMAAKLTEQLMPQLGAARAYRARVFATMRADSLGSVRRIAEPVLDWLDIEAAFDGITYAKGGAVLQMFESWLGEEAFRQAVRDYIARHAHGNARGGDLVAALAARSDDPEATAQAFRHFIQKPGVPELSIELLCDGPSVELDVRQRRYLPVGSSADPELQWSLPLCVRFGSDAQAERHCALLDALARQRIALPADSCPQWLMPNAGGNGYYRFLMSPAQLQALAGAADQLDHAELLAYADALDAGLQSGRITVAEWLRTTAPLAGSDSVEIALAPAFRARWLLTHVYADSPYAEPLRQLLAERYQPALQQLGRDGGTAAAQRLRAELTELLAMDAREPLLRAALSNSVQQALAAEDLTTLDETTRASALQVFIEDGDENAFDALYAALSSTRDPRLRRELLQALSRATLAELHTRALALSLTDKIASGERLGLLAGLFASREHAASARAWFDQNEDAVMQSVPGFAQSRAPALYGSNMCRTQDADMLQQRFAERMATTAGGPRALAQAVESITLCAALRDKLMPSRGSNGPSQM